MPLYELLEGRTATRKGYCCFDPSLYRAKDSIGKKLYASALLKVPYRHNSTKAPLSCRAAWYRA